MESSEAEFVAELPMNISLNCLDELLELVPPTTCLEEAYLWERQVFFIHTGLTLGEALSESRFKFLWKEASFLHCENLFTEIVLRGDVIPENPVATYFLIGDYGARVLQFYATLEAQIQN